MTLRLLPQSALPDAIRLLSAKGIRAFADGFVSIILPAYLITLGFDATAVGVLSTATLLGSAAATLGVGWLAGRARRRTLLLIASVIMVATGLCFAWFDSYWPLLVVAMIGTINPSAGDVSVFYPLEYAALAGTAADKDRTALFARYSLVGSLAGAFGALFAGVPQLVGAGADALPAFKAMFVLYAVIGIGAGLIYRRLDSADERNAAVPSAPLGPSRRRVWGLAALFCVDSFGGGLIVQSMLALWLFDRFALSLGTTANIFFFTNLLTAASFLAAAPLARRIGLINTMVFTHLPSSISLMLVPFAPTIGIAIALLLFRSALSTMDVPARTSYVMAVVTPPERTAAASFTAVPRSLAAALGPAAAGVLLTASAFGWPLLIGGALKAIYDIALWVSFRAVRPPEETR